ncbi:MAG: YihA family ribosome biogenesis GTP-binding protein [Clostridiales bacterium]|nr:YihA family ribosome biogenesis GTP-binding protein [Clostridiales bacterium]
MITNAEFVTSASNLTQMKNYAIEIAVVGKSNVGKSSFINSICNNKNLARTSKEPGRTRLINYFSINNGEFCLVDLPGYGYAKVSKEEKIKWGKLIENYLQNSHGLKCIFMLVDIRHDPTEDDKLMIRYLYHYRIPFIVIATKSDKLSRSAGLRRKNQIANCLALGIDNLYVYSSQNRQGKEEILTRISDIVRNSQL